MSTTPLSENILPKYEELLMYEIPCINGIKCKFFYRYQTNDIGVIQSTVVQDEYRFSTVNNIPGDFAIDIGSHIGTSSILLAILGLKVFSFEMIPENIDIQRKNIDINNLNEKIYLFPFAVVGKNNINKGYIRYSNIDATPGELAHKYIGTLYPETNTSHRLGTPINIDSININSVLQSVRKQGICKIMKIDAEGSEWDIIKNIDHNLIKDTVNLIVGELHIDPETGSQNYKDLYEYIHNEYIDITPTYSSGEYLRPEYRGMHFAFINRNIL